MRAPEFWYHTSTRLSAPFLRRLLWPFSLIYYQGLKHRFKSTKPHLADLPVICVGNIVLGGVGKTPLVREISKILMSEFQHRACVLMRGYKGALPGPVWANSKKHTAHHIGDEALLLGKTALTQTDFLSVCVSKDRKKGALKISEFNLSESKQDNRFDLILMDDGLQNPDLAKDFNFLVIDDEQGLGNGRLFPAGPLREPLIPVLSRIDAIILMVRAFSKDSRFLSDFGPLLKQKFNRIPILKARLKPAPIQFPGSAHKDTDPIFDPTQRFVSFAGIGRPEKFFTSLTDLGFNLCYVMPFPDHHAYSEKNIKALYQIAKIEKAMLITTEKDWVRLPPQHQKKIAYLPVSVEFETKAELQDLLKSFLQNTPLLKNPALPLSRRKHHD